MTEYKVAIIASQNFPTPVVSLEAPNQMPIGYGITGVSIFFEGDNGEITTIACPHLSDFIGKDFNFSSKWKTIPRKEEFVVRPGEQLFFVKGPDPSRHNNTILCISSELAQMSGPEYFLVSNPPKLGVGELPPLMVPGDFFSIKKRWHIGLLDIDVDVTEASFRWGQDAILAQRYKEELHMAQYNRTTEDVERTVNGLLKAAEDLKALYKRWESLTLEAYLAMPDDEKAKLNG